MPPTEIDRFDPGSSGVLASGRLFKTRSLLWALFLFTVVLWFFFASIFAARWLGLHGNWTYAPPTVLPLLACWIYALLVRRFERRPPWEIQISPALLFDVPIGFLFGAVFITGMWLLVWSLKLSAAHRGTGVILSSVLFGLAHITHGSWLAVLGIILNAGIAMALLYVITGRLWMSIGMHLGYDFVETSVLGIGNHHGLLINTPKPGAAAWLTGGTFGPDAAVPAMILGLLINVALWRLAFRKRMTIGTG
jgi:hypothetical protein